MSAWSKTKEGSHDDTLTKNNNIWASLHPVGCRAAKEAVFMLFMAALKPAGLHSCVTVIRVMQVGGPGLAR